MPKLTAGGGWPAIAYTASMARRVGWIRLWRAMRSRNTCKTCALGMGGQRGGMVNESGHFPEVCKKSLQAMAADMQDAIPDAFFRTTSIADLRHMTPRQLEHAGRLVTPLRARPGATHYEPATWDSVLYDVASTLREAPPDEIFFYFSGRSSNEAAFLLQLFARAIGTNNVNNCSYYCHQASGAGLQQSIGTGTATVELSDVEKADLFVLIGGNPASNHPRLMSQLVRLRRRGGEVVVVNPAKELGLLRFRVPSDLRSLLTGTEIAGLYVQPHIGGDIAWMTGVAKTLLARGEVDRDFVDRATEGWEAFRAHIEAASWDDILERSGVSREAIDAIADRYLRAERVIFAWTMGITHHAHGVENVQWIANLALLRGMVGRPYAGLLPIRGHSNVQGIGTVGAKPALAKAVMDRLAGAGVTPPSTPGRDTMACMESAAAGEMRVGIALGGNLYGSNPDSTFAARALGRVGTLVYLSTTLNTGHAHGTGEDTIILPVLARDEEPYATTQESMFNFVRLSSGGRPRHEGPRGEVQVVADLAARTTRSHHPDSPVDWQALGDAEEVRQLIARVIPDLGEMASIGRDGREFHIPGRILHAPRFRTPSGRARLHPHAIPEPTRPCEERFSLRLMTVRSEGQFNTVVYEEEDLYRGQERRDVILMSAGDMAARSLGEDDVVTVESETGCLRDVRVRVFDVREGNVIMYYPEANVLVSRRVDPVSRTPAFKATWVSVRREVPTVAGAPRAHHEIGAARARPTRRRQ